MATREMQFTHKALVSVKVGVFDASMSSAERAHGFHVCRSNLTAAPLSPHQILNAMGQQTGQSAVVEGSVAGLLRHFQDHWTNFRNLTIVSWHDSPGTIINNTTVAGDPSILLPIQNGALANCRQPVVKFVRVKVAVDYSYTLRGVSPICLDFYVELPQTLAPHVADVSPTCRRHRQMSPNLGRHCVSLRHGRGPDIPNLYQLLPTSTNQPKHTGT